MKSKIFQSDLFDNPNLIEDKDARTLSYNCMYDNVGVDQNVIDDLRNLANKSKGCSVRVNLHDAPCNDFHQMIIAHKKSCYYRPHKHIVKCEAYHMIEGEMQVFIFTDEGEVDYTTVLASQSSKKPFIFRIENDKWHCTIPLTEIVLFHESKVGPFDADTDVVYPTWSPDSENEVECQNYIKILFDIGGVNSNTV